MRVDALDSQGNIRQNAKMPDANPSDHIRRSVEEKLEQCRTNLARTENGIANLQREALVIKAEIQAYQHVLDLLPTKGGKSDGERPARRQSERRGRRGSEGWSSTMVKLAEHQPSLPFTLDHVIAVASLVGFKPTRGNVRSQMATYVNRGVLERVGLGAFQFTETGLAAFRPKSPDRDEPSAADTQAESAA